MQKERIELTRTLIWCTQQKCFKKIKERMAENVSNQVFYK